MTDSIKVFPDAHLVVHEGKALRLSPTLFAVVECLARHNLRIMSTGLICDQIYPPGAILNSDTGDLVRSHVRLIRKRLAEAYGHSRWLRNSYAAGYFWDRDLIHSDGSINMAKVDLRNLGEPL